MLKIENEIIYTEEGGLMSDLQKYIKQRKARDPEFAKNYDRGYEAFKIGVMLKMAREEGLKVDIFRPITLFPFPVKPLSDLSRSGKCFLVAELSLGQLIEDVRLSVNTDSQVELVNQFSGVPISSDEILEAIERIMK